MVFLRPMVIRTQEQSNALSLDRYDLIRAQQQQFGQPKPNAAMTINDAPVAPPAPASAPPAAAPGGGNPVLDGPVPPPLSWPEPTQAPGGTPAATPPPAPAPASPPAPRNPAMPLEMP
jgi:general secretion pathway protein D